MSDECQWPGCKREATHLSGLTPIAGWQPQAYKRRMCAEHTNLRVGDLSGGWWFRSL